MSNGAIDAWCEALGFPHRVSAGNHAVNIRVFRQYDYNAWRHGYWYHGCRNGRYAWWWYGGGTWYPYAKPIYPYPNPYIPPTIIVQQPPPVQSVPPPSQAWYYCPNPQGYYPYVPQCAYPWQAVPATPQ